MTVAAMSGVDSERGGVAVGAGTVSVETGVVEGLEEGMDVEPQALVNNANKHTNDSIHTVHLVFCQCRLILGFNSSNMTFLLVFRSCATRA